MQILVTIPDEFIQALKDGSYGAKYSMYALCGCIMNGTIIPENHGRIIDESKITSCNWDGKRMTTNAPTII